MRYTTPEWLLENLEKRLRLALQQEMAAPELAYTAGSSSERNANELTPTVSLQSVA